MKSAQDEVNDLLGQIMDRAKDPVVEKLGDRISQICRAHIGATISDDFQEYAFTPEQSRFFTFLASKEGKIVTKSAVMSAIAKPGKDEPQQKILDVLVCRIRKKIANGPWRLETIQSQGWRLVRKDEPRHPRYFNIPAGRWRPKQNMERAHAA